MTDAVLVADDGDEPPVHFEVNENLEIVEEAEGGLTVYGDVADSSPNEPWVEDITSDSPRGGWHAPRAVVRELREQEAGTTGNGGWNPADRETVVWDDGGGDDA